MSSQDEPAIYVPIQGTSRVNGVWVGRVKRSDLEKALRESEQSEPRLTREQ